MEKFRRKWNLVGITVPNKNSEMFPDKLMEEMEKII